jgi:copper chaperone
MSAGRSGAFIAMTLHVRKSCLIAMWGFPWLEGQWLFCTFLRLDLTTMGSPISMGMRRKTEVLMQLRIDGMTCGGCARSVTGAIVSLDPSAKVEIDLSSRRVEVETSASESEIRRVLGAAGYPANPQIVEETK